MKNATLIMVLLLFFNSLAACTSRVDHATKKTNTIQWDFDHQLQFIKSPLTNNAFQLEIIPNKQVNFKTLATFLLRKSYRICGGYQYTIEIIQGIEGFDNKRAMPNYIARSLIAKVQC